MQPPRLPKHVALGDIRACSRKTLASCQEANALPCPAQAAHLAFLRHVDCIAGRKSQKCLRLRSSVRSGATAGRAVRLERSGWERGQLGNLGEGLECSCQARHGRQGGSQPGSGLGGTSAETRTLCRRFVTRLFSKSSRWLISGVRPFDIHLWVSGYAASTRSLAEATRGQRALVSLAKRDIDHATQGARRSSVGYAALPRPFDGTPVATAESEDFPTKTSRPDHISTLATPAHESSRPRSDTIEATDISFKLPNIAQIANRNLDMRLSPFWSKPLALRPIRISVEPPPDHRTVHSSGHCADQESGAEPLLIVGSSTDGQGHFAHRLIIPWERLRAHSSWPHSSDMSQIDRQKWRLRVSVRLEGSKLPVSASTYATNARPMTSQERHIADATPDGSSRLLLGSQEPQQNSVVGPSNISPVLSSLPPDDQGVCQAAESHLDMAVQSDGGIRIISDLVCSDDCRWSVFDWTG